MAPNINALEWLEGPPEEVFHLEKRPPHQNKHLVICANNNIQ